MATSFLKALNYKYKLRLGPKTENQTSVLRCRPSTRVAKNVAEGLELWETCWGGYLSHGAWYFCLKQIFLVSSFKLA